MADWNIQFSSEQSAERALNDAGFSLGRLQRDEPRGILFGDYDIAKWRNMTTREKSALHGTMQRHGGPGSQVTITLRSGGAPGPALRALETASERDTLNSKGHADE